MPLCPLPGGKILPGVKTAGEEVLVTGGVNGEQLRSLTTPRMSDAIPRWSGLKVDVEFVDTGTVWSVIVEFLRSGEEYPEIIYSCLYSCLKSCCILSVSCRFVNTVEFPPLDVAPGISYSEAAVVGLPSIMALLPPVINEAVRIGAGKWRKNYISMHEVKVL
jgi:hypothetical protein